MRNILFRLSMSLFVVGTIALFSSCQDQVEQVAGTYSYKISGSVIVSEDTVSLVDEMGAMELIRKDSTSAVVTFNALNGPAYTAEAEIHGNQIRLQAYQRRMTIRAKEYTITGSGNGTIYSNTIIIALQYRADDVSTNQLTLLCKKD